MQHGTKKSSIVAFNITLTQSVRLWTTSFNYERATIKLGNSFITPQVKDEVYKVLREE